METETIWKPVDGWPYEVSNHGDVRNKQGRVLRPASNGIGYLRLCLRDNGRAKTLYVHRLVCQAFLGSPQCGLEVDHINHDRSDNRVSNLRWLPVRENRQRKHSNYSELCRIKAAERRRFSEEKIRQIRTSYSGKRGQIIGLANAHGVSPRLIRFIIRRECYGDVA